MIKKILGFNKKSEIRIHRTYAPSLSPTTIQQQVLTSTTNIIVQPTYKIVYERFAGIYISIVTDTEENEFYVLDFINKFVVVLDRYFGRVCEMNLVYEFVKVHCLLDILVGGGMVLETDEEVVVKKMNEMGVGGDVRESV